MGVPKFYRWISERYPKINQVITDAALLPEFDHLYLDMNGIIHGCTHPSHLDVSTVLSEKDMMLGIMHYLDRIITQIVKPKVSVFMAIDGVAPRAKLNQQRSRRFRSAKDMAEAKEAKERENKVPKFKTAAGNGATDYDASNEEDDQSMFDSNCITPGTEFMERVSNCIKYFIRKKIKEDPLWRNLKIIFSGHEIPGEGEHKIMQHIRDMRSQPGYKPNTRHCMYGQDADLIMLGLVSHEPHFTLLREIVDFGGGFGRNDNALKAVTKFTKQSDFQLLHLSILREYLAIEFAYNKSDGDDLERLIDDFVFLTFLVGNDFLPHMPSLDIGDGAFDLLFNTYKAHRPTWGKEEGDQYLTISGEITNAARLEAFIKDIGAAETEIFEKREIDEAAYTQKRRRWDKRDGKKQGPTDDEIAAEEEEKQGSYVEMVNAMLKKHGADAKFVDGWDPSIMEDSEGTKDFKGRYYYEKLHFTPVSIDDHLALRKAYIEGLLWCLAYYYKGCISWGWFYPYHYGPMLSDLTDLPNVFNQIKFDIGAPLKPFEQLMGCLPPGSASIVPRPYRRLMCSSDSPIANFYPKEFEIDMNGKKNPWEGVNLLPFIDVKLLKDTITKECPDEILTPDERRRNARGKVFLYTYDAAIESTVPSFNRDIGIPDILRCSSKVDVIDASDDTSNPFKPKLIEGTIIPLPGFPSLNVLPIQATELRPIELNCFGSASKYHTTVLTLQTLPQLPTADALAESVIGKSLFINWPMMHEAKVVAVSDSTQIIRMVKKKKKVKKFSEKEAKQWSRESEMTVQNYLKGTGMPGSGGVVIGDIQIRLKLLPLQGMKTSLAKGSMKKVFGTEEADVPLQMVLLKSPAPDPRFQERGPITLKDRFPSQCDVILTKGKFRGCKGTVLNVFDDGKVGVKVKALPPEPPFGLAIARTVQESYISSYDAAKVLNMNPGIFGKVTGSVLFQPGRYDVGLNLKYQKDFCVLGYTRMKSNDNNKKQSKNEKKSAWGNADTVLVVGNQQTEDNGNNDNNGGRNGKKSNGTWEFTPKAVRLVAAFRQRFPSFFTAISRNSRERVYDANILGPNGVNVLSEIREWLNNIETAKMPRTPCSTDAMPTSAIAAVQRAADVRVAAQAENPIKDTNIKVPPSVLYRECSTAPTDVLQSSEEGPGLGDRIVNLCANGVPFGARGTVVGIHSSKSGCVEVVMDEEFIGGGTLQGSCSSFRGKLCVWNHLLKISASNSMDIVEQMIPTGSGKTAIANMLAPGENESKAVVQKNGGKKEDKPASVEPAQLAAKNSHPITKDENNRSVSNPRGGKQGYWREAKGPKSEKGVGFKGAGRGGKSGLQCWRQLLDGKGPIRSNTPKKNGKGKETNSAASVGLKAMLGVTSSTEPKSEAKPTKPPTQMTDATAGLKNILGVAPVAEPTPPVPLPAPAPAPPVPKQTAADALMQMMFEAPQGNSVPPPVPQQPPQPSGFNFTYLKDGEAPPPPAMAPPPHMAQGTPAPYAYPMMMPMPPNGMHPVMGMNMTPGNYPIPVQSVPIPVVKKEEENGNATVQ